MARYAYRVGDHHVGVQTNDPRIAAVLRDRLGHHRVDDARTPANISIYGDPERPLDRCVFRVYRGCDHVFTARSADRAVAFSAGLLEGFLPPRPRSSGLLELRTLVLVDEHRALLAPRQVLVRAPAIETRLRRTGIRVLEHHDALVEVQSRTIIVPTSRMLPPERDAPGCTATGARQLIAWVFDEPDDHTPATRAHAAVHALRVSRPTPPDRATFDLVTRLLADLPMAHVEASSFECEIRRRFGRWHRTASS